MPLNKRNTRTVHRTCFAGITETVTLLKRNDDQQQGTVRSIKLFRCRKGQIAKTGESILGDMAASHTATWHIPRSQLDLVGVAYLNSLDRIVDKQGRTWQPESTTGIDVKLFENEVDLACLLVSTAAEA